MNFHERLDAILQLLQNMPPWEIYRFEEAEGGRVKPVPWYVVTGQQVVHEAALKENDLHVQLSALPAQIGFWARMVALCERVLEWEDRNYRVWRDSTKSEAYRRPEGDENWKKPTKDEVEAVYRVMPEYALLNDRVERAREAVGSTKAVLSAFEAKRDMVRAAVRRSIQDGSPQIAV